ncbi:MAG: hypothetical protein GTN80_07955 [Nitrososphaeria archaeon]|nr:hypothetical protein [Nitrososphaeria archaeon]NIN52997.1 hypothetical protein [Nitrososphaeria archaeon]NIQ33556.1 hypothetical protein [Nitrososphaeria archaeon]
MIKVALISVSDKTGLESLVEILKRYSVKIIASGGTAKRIRELGYEAKEVSQVTSFPEMPGELVKTLHPKIHGGILGDPDDEEQCRYMRNHSIEPIDLVVVNLYPFEEVIERKATLKEVVRYIDIGGVALVRAAAKGALQHGRVAVVTNPDQYELILRELEENNGVVASGTLERLAVEAFKATSRYDAVIEEYLNKRLLRGEDVRGV